MLFCSHVWIQNINEISWIYSLVFWTTWKSSFLLRVGVFFIYLFLPLAYIFFSFFMSINSKHTTFFLTSFPAAASKEKEKITKFSQKFQLEFIWKENYRNCSKENEVRVKIRTLKNFFFYLWRRFYVCFSTTFFRELSLQIKLNLENITSLSMMIFYLLKIFIVPNFQLFSYDSWNHNFKYTNMYSISEIFSLIFHYLSSFNSMLLVSLSSFIITLSYFSADSDSFHSIQWT
jgi:hypothetical protein